MGHGSSRVSRAASISDALWTVTTSALVGFIIGLKWAHLQAQDEVSCAKEQLAVAQESEKQARAALDEAKGRLEKQQLELGEAQESALKAKQSADEMWTRLAKTAAAFEIVESELTVAKAQRASERDLPTEGDAWYYTWDISEQACAMQSMACTDHMESPHFPLNGTAGFTLRYWPNWDPANGRACMRLCSLTAVQSQFRLGVGTTVVQTKEVTIPSADSSNSSELWFFEVPPADSEDSNILWVETEVNSS